ncbi:hypothetical protein ScPMuIL_014285 [Solemya velum]
MSRRGGFRVTTKYDGTRSFGEHDDRWQQNDQRPRHSRGRRPWGGKNNNSYSRGGGPRRGGRSGPDPRSRLDDDGDVSMSDTDRGSGHQRYNPYGRQNRGYDNRRDSRPDDQSRDRARRMGLPIDNSAPSADKWYKVTIPYGQKAEKSFVLKSLTNMSDVPFKPINYHYDQNRAVFYVQDKRAADALKRCHRRITMPSGFKMLLLVNLTNPPVLPMDPETVEKLKVCLSDRYEPSLKALNLSDLGQDEGLKNAGVYFTATRTDIINKIASIIGENIPELECLNMSKNKMRSLDIMSRLVTHAPNVTKLDLRDNKLRHISDLNLLKQWKLDEIVLDGNELCDKFHENSVYISAVRERFPKIKKLDGHDLPPPITFDIEADVALPPTKESFFLNSEVQTIMVKFLKEYFTLFDSDNRHNLLQAYHEDAVFSVSCSYHVLVQSKQANLKEYFPHCRNLTRAIEKDRRQKLLKRGNGAIVAALFQLPKTIHDPNSIVVDVSHASSSLLVFTVSGVFKEADSKADKPPIRAFSRQFLTIPSGSGMVIANDMLHITNASSHQAQKAFKQLAPTPSSSPVPETSQQAPFPQPGPAFTVEQQAMIAKFSEQSAMNMEWSAKCLEQNGWNYEKSGQVFLELQREMKIPSEAFVK